ncbi:MAG TPA: hypothetical protein VFL17_17850 [Anaerolineae bacterium]|nr:hypothetical protein [Anaerolineae bacterium]
MPISEEALTGLRAAIEWNPYGARELLAILKEFPTWMKYKDDAYGPLGLILFGIAPRQRIADGVNVPMKTAPFPEDKFAACQVFGEEWKRRAFTKQELADRIEVILAELNIRF